MPKIRIDQQNDTEDVYISGSKRGKTIVEKGNYEGDESPITIKKKPGNRP